MIVLLGLWNFGFTLFGRTLHTHTLTSLIFGFTNVCTSYNYILYYASVSLVRGLKSRRVASDSCRPRASSNPTLLNIYDGFFDSANNTHSEEEDFVQCHATRKLNSVPWDNMNKSGILFGLEDSCPILLWSLGSEPIHKRW